MDKLDGKLVYFMNEDKIVQKIVCLRAVHMKDSGDYFEYDTLQRLFEQGWVIKEMHAAGSGEWPASCFVWLEKQNDEKP